MIIMSMITTAIATSTNPARHPNADLHSDTELIASDAHEIRIGTLA